MIKFAYTTFKSDFLLQATSMNKVNYDSKTSCQRKKIK